MKTTIYNLQERLINFAAEMISFTERLPPDFACKHLGRQLIRSATSTALNYGEAQAAESRADFIHKLKISLKELRESFVCMKILQKKTFTSDEIIMPLICEANELIAIFVASLKTVQQNIPGSKNK